MAAAATATLRLQSMMSSQMNYDRYGRQAPAQVQVQPVGQQPNQQAVAGGHASAQYSQAGPSSQNHDGGHHNSMQAPAGTASQQSGSSSDRYQPSRGAQRDAKWRARNAERVAQLAAQQAAAPVPQWRQQTPSHYYAALPPPPQQQANHHHHQHVPRVAGDQSAGAAGSGPGPSTHYAMLQRGQTQYERPQAPLHAGLPVGSYTKERSGTHEREGRNEMYHRDEREHRQDVASAYRMQRQTPGPVPQPSRPSTTSDQITRSPPQQHQAYAAAMAARYGAQAQMTNREAPKPPVGAPAPATGLQVRPPMGNQPSRMTPEQMRKQQMATIAAARQAHIAATRKAAAEAETERKIRRIQLQVFVHARPTYCAWKGCRAVLNSWALLEKHVLHCHLHPSMMTDGANSTTTPVAQLFELDPDGEQEEEEAVRRRRVRYQSPEPVRIPCGWTGCTSVFETREAAYQHVLLGHMGEFSARCPFNCLYEGAKFSELMAHIGRRHPTATPEHFVPGLIHHKPTGLPPTESLPRLPTHASLKVGSPTEAKSHSDVTPRACGCAMSEIGARTKRLVMRRCFAGTRPKKEDYVEKAGAGAGIKAVVENARRLSAAIPSRPAAAAAADEAVASASPDSGTAEGQQPSRRPLRATRLTISAAAPDVSSPTSKTPKTALVDVRTSVREAKRSARQELRDLGGDNTAYQLSSSSESSSSSSDDEADAQAQSARKAATSDPKVHHDAKISPRLGVTLLSDTESSSSRSRESSASDDASDTSEFRIKLKMPSGDRNASEDAADGQENHVTRSQRLKRKGDELEEAAEPHGQPAPIKMKMWR